jgi:TPR repeat protein
MAGRGGPANPGEALGRQLRAAEAGDAACMFDLAYALEEGKVVDADLPEAMSWYRRAAAAGNGRARCYLGELSLQGAPRYGVDLDPHRAYALFLGALEAGERGAFCRIGGLYLGGLGVPRDRTTARRWIERGARAGDPDAMESLATFLLHDPPTDPPAAIAWHRRAADLGNAMAMTQLGFAYQAGTGVAADARQAASWFRRAAEAGDPAGMTSWGVCLTLGEGVAKDEVEGAQWYLRAAAAGDPTGMEDAAHSLWLGRGVRQDLDAAARWYRAAIDRGSVHAREALGVLLVQRGDMAGARQCFERAAAAGDLEAMVNLATILRREHAGVPADPAAAVRWLRTASDKGAPQAMVLLAEMLLAGEGGRRDPARALALLRRAAEGGDRAGMLRLAEVLRTGAAGPVDEAGARRWADRAEAAPETTKDQVHVEIGPDPPATR